MIFWHFKNSSASLGKLPVTQPELVFPVIIAYICALL
jgi:hypothetical protein